MTEKVGKFIPRVVRETLWLRTALIKYLKRNLFQGFNKQKVPKSGFFSPIFAKLKNFSTLKDFLQNSRKIQNPIIDWIWDF